MTPVTVITGASAGIGAALARVFAAHSHQTLLVARGEQRLTDLSEEIAAAGHPAPHVLAMDVAEPHAAERIGETLSSLRLGPEYVINNAGFGLVGPAAELDRDEQLAMIDLNARALTSLSLAFVEKLERRRGGILNVASVAGFVPGPGSAVYYAGKGFVLSLSEALHQELRPRGIRVTCLCPGPVATEFQARAGIADTPSWPLAISAQAVAEAGYRGLMRGKRVVIPGWANKLVANLAPRLVPRAILLAQLEARQHGRRKR